MKASITSQILSLRLERGNSNALDRLPGNANDVAARVLAPSREAPVKTGAQVEQCFDATITERAADAERAAASVHKQDCHVLVVGAPVSEVYMDGASRPQDNSQFYEQSWSAWIALVGVRAEEVKRTAAVLVELALALLVDCAVHVDAGAKGCGGFAVAGMERDGLCKAVGERCSAIIVTCCFQ